MFLGASSLVDFKLGALQVERIYLGANEVWSNSTFDPDAAAYIAAVETADGQALESDVKIAINNFVVTCKINNLWDSIENACITLGARTLAGALIPLKGADPTGINLVEGDYIRDFGIGGNRLNKVINSNRSNAVDILGNNHRAVYMTQRDLLVGKVMSGWGAYNQSGANFTEHSNINEFRVFNYSQNAGSLGITNDTTFTGAFITSRVSGTSYSVYSPTTNIFASAVAQSPAYTADNYVLAAGTATGFRQASVNRVAFYSFGLGFSNAGLMRSALNALVSEIQDALPFVLDADAAAYIAAIESALGFAITETQSNAINDFIRAEKLAGRYYRHKMIYLPIWANAAANAIDLISLTSGTFVGDVTHGSGYIQGDGTTGYFRTGKIASTLGLDLATNYGSASVLVNRADSRNQNAEWLSATDGSNRRLILGQAINNFTSGISYYSAASTSFSDNLKRGIYTVSVESSSLRRLRRYSNGNVLAASASRSLLNTFTPPRVEQYLLARNNNNAGATLHTDARLGFAHMGFVMTQTELNDFANNVETLWETCTGLTLP